jgi:hypothetical protein
MHLIVKSLSFRFLKSSRLFQDVFTDIWVYRAKLNDDVVVKAYLLLRSKNYKIKSTDFLHLIVKLKRYYLTSQ